VLNRVLRSDLSWPSYPTTGVFLIPRVRVVGPFPETSGGPPRTRLLRPPAAWTCTRTSPLPPFSRGKFDTLVRLLKKGKDCAYTDAMRMCKATREQFNPWLQELQELSGVIVEWVFFENNVAAANHNCINDLNRTDG
jgi:hypothetical protein